MIFRDQEPLPSASHRVGRLSAAIFKVQTLSRLAQYDVLFFP